jgi:hypothetical protein
MKQFPIDSILLAIENRADFLGKKIEKDERYLFICETLANFEVSGTIEYKDKERTYFNLQELCQDYDLDFKTIMLRILLGE